MAEQNHGGYQLSGNQIHGQVLLGPLDIPAHKYAGTVSGSPRSLAFSSCVPEETCPCPDGQHVGSGVCQPPGMTSVPRVTSLSLLAIDLGTTEPTIPQGCSSTRSGELGCGPPLEGGSSPVRMATPPLGGRMHLGTFREGLREGLERESDISPGGPQMPQENLVLALGDPATPGSPQSDERHSLALRTRQTPTMGLALNGIICPP
ncbi:UNVERIFIED_CONTAM: hypothetical protein FKN15_075037 [Acipenser sinensis]